MHDDKQTNEQGRARGWAIGMAVAAGLVRLIAHPQNFTPVAGLGLFGGARLRSWWAYLLPLGVMAVTDVMLWGIRGHFDYTLWRYAFDPWVYASFLLAVLCGRWLLRNGSAGRIALVSVLISVLFFLLTNFGAWLTLSVDPQTLSNNSVAVFEDNAKYPAPIPKAYARNLSGLLACYVAALPFAGTNAPPFGFFGNQLVGDLLYTGLLFGVYAWLRRFILAPRRLEEPAVARAP